jgi:hypothetical protein
MIDLDEIRQRYFNEGQKVDKHWMESLRWHLKNGDQFRTVDLIGDIALCSDPSVNELAPDVLNLLDQDDDFIGMEVVSCILGYMKLPEYVEYFLNFYETDRGYEYDDNVKDRIIFALGNVINKIVDLKLKHRAAEFLLSKLSDEQSVDNKSAAYSSIMTAMGIDKRGRPLLETEEELIQNIDWKLVEEFKEKYLH